MPQIRSWRMLLSKLNTLMYVDLQVEPLVICWPLSDQFHIRDELLATNLKNSNNVILKTPKIEFKIGKQINLSSNNLKYFHKDMKKVLMIFMRI